MNKAKLGFGIFLLAIIAVVCPIAMSSDAVAVAQSNKSIIASTDAPANDGKEIVKGTDITDSVLYDRLSLAIGHGNTAYTVKQYSFWDFEVLDLSGSTTHSEKITSLAGLDKLDFRNLKVLKLNYNNLGNIDASVFKYMKSLQTLELIGSNVTSIDVSELTNLHSINLQNNNITEIKLNKMVVNGSEYVSEGYYDTLNKNWVTTTSTQAVIDLSNNLITSMDNIKLPADTPTNDCVVNLYSNAIVDYEDSLQHFTINLGVQGLNSALFKTHTVEDEKLYYAFKSTKFSYNHIGDDKFEVRLTRTYTEDKVEKSEIILWNDVSTTDGAVLTLDNGHYLVDYYYNGQVVDYDNSQWQMYESIEFDIYPSTPTYYYEVKGKRYDDLTLISRVTTVKFESEENADIYFKYDNGEWVKGNSFTITQGGYHTISVKCIDGDYESMEKVILITASSNLKVPTILIIALLVCGILVFGFVLMPLIRKYIIKA